MAAYKNYYRIRCSMCKEADDVEKKLAELKLCSKCFKKSVKWLSGRVMVRATGRP